jgi:hypothetical protein
MVATNNYKRLVRSCRIGKFTAVRVEFSGFGSVPNHQAISHAGTDDWYI